MISACTKGTTLNLPLQPSTSNNTPTTHSNTPAQTPPAYTPPPSSLPTLSTSSTPTSSNPQPITNYTTTISSQKGWQQTPLYLNTGKSFYVIYQGGEWTVDKSNFPYVGPDGYQNNIDNKIANGYKVISSVPYGTLIAKIGNGNLFAIGNKTGAFRADGSGYLFLRINDTDVALGDNSGSVTVTVGYDSEQSSPASSPEAVPPPSSYTSTSSNPQLTPPPAPGNAQAEATDQTHIRITWADNSGGQASFNIFDTQALNATVNSGTTSYTFNDVTPGSYHCFHIQAFNSAGSSAWTDYTCVDMTDSSKALAFREKMFQYYGFTSEASQHVRSTSIIVIHDPPTEGGGFWWPGYRKVELFGFSHEAAVHELSHAWWEDYRMQNHNLIIDLAKDVVRLADMDPRLNPDLASAIAFARGYVYGIENWKGMYSTDSGSADVHSLQEADFSASKPRVMDWEIYAGFCSWTMGRFKEGSHKLPNFMWRYFDPEFIGRILVTPYYDGGGSQPELSPTSSNPQPSSTLTEAVPPPPSYISPGHAATVSSIPTLSWRSNGGTSSTFSVILSLNNHNVQQSPWISGTSWQPSAPLEPGWYAWHVLARNKSGANSDASSCWSNGYSPYGDDWWEYFTYAPSTSSTQRRFTLNVVIPEHGQISYGPSPDSDGKYASGTVVTITALPWSGWSFQSWSGAVSGSASTVTVTMDADKAVAATFVEKRR